MSPNLAASISGFSGDEGTLLGFRKCRCQYAPARKLSGSTDWTSRTGSFRAAQPGAGTPCTDHHCPCNPPESLLSTPQRHRRCLIAPGPGRPRNNWLRRMYARLLFVVVGIFGPVSARFTPPEPVAARSRLGMTRTRRYTLAHA